MLRSAILGSAAAAALLMAGPALAAAFTVTPGAEFIIPTNNNFKGDLNAEGLTSYWTTGSTITLNYSQKLKFEFMASESGNTNRFTAGSIPEFTEIDKGWGATLIGLQNYSAGAISDWTFNASGTPTNIGDDGFGIFVPSGLLSYSSNVLYLGLDDFINNQDDNHDDFIIRVTAMPVPEPASWAMLIMGFGLVGAVARRRTMKEVTA